MKQPVERPDQVLANYGILVLKLSNDCDYFLRLSGFPDLSGKEFSTAFKFSLTWLLNNVSREQYKEHSLINFRFAKI